jgi:lipoyl(octanoyl) transferase
MPLQIQILLSEGLISYRDGWDRQRELVARRQADAIPDTLLLLEHAPVVSYGKAANPASRLLTEAEYASRGIELVATDRGGDVTYHGPGQLVGYPIIKLPEGSRDLHRYVRFLETVLISAAAEMGVPDAGRADWHAGVWVGDGYLAAIGVRVARWVTHHGFALNVTEAVHEGFSTIVPCGVAGKPIVTLSECAKREISIIEAAETISKHFTNYFNEFVVNP